MEEREQREEGGENVDCLEDWRKGEDGWFCGREGESDESESSLGGEPTRSAR